MYKEFYKNGIVNIDFGNEELDNALKELLNNNVKKDFKLVSKYPKTFDLRPDVINYDPIFIQSLKKHNIKEVLKMTTLKELSLFHVQVRIVEDEKSYMNWHRDTYYNNENNLIGKAPHPLKIIYYPNFNGDSEKDRLLYLLGSNRIVFPNNNFDKELFRILTPVKIKTCNKSAVLFDVNGLHAVCPENKTRSIRLIYSFLSKEQIMDDHKDEELHMQAMRMYEAI